MSIDRLLPTKLTVRFDIYANGIKSSPGRRAYDQIRLITIAKAEAKGLKGCEYQAIIWKSVKNNF